MNSSSPPAQAEVNTKKKMVSNNKSTCSVHYWVMLLLLVVTAGCSQAVKLNEVKSGRLKFVKTLNYGNVGSHGSRGWYVSDRKFYFNEKDWKPAGINVKEDIAGCEASPNESIEVLKCYSFTDLRERVSILRIKNGEAEWVTVSDKPYGRGENLGEWVGDGDWLLFLDSLVNVKTLETRAVLGLPEAPGSNGFRAVSPDLEKIVYQGDCFYGDNLPAAIDRRPNNTCARRTEYLDRKIELLWVFDVKTGDAKLIEASREKHAWLIWNQELFANRTHWLKFYQSQLIWRKDRDEKYQLVFR